MTLRRRISAAAAAAVAAVAIILGLTGYLSTRSHLIGGVRSELRQRAASSSRASGQGGNPNQQLQCSTPTRTRRSGGGPHVPSAPPLGGAPGYFQFVCANGSVRAGTGGMPQLPVDAQARAVARGTRGSFFDSTRVKGVHVEIYTARAPGAGYAIEVALPLTDVDSALSGLLLDDVLLIGAGVLVAGLLGALIARSALAPITAFTRDTERATQELDHPRRLTEDGAAELRRLAMSFNRTLDALDRSIQTQRHLIADTSHELRTPMAALRSNVQIFLDADRLPAEERVELQQAILAELDDLTGLVADVVELARGAQPDSHVEAVDLAEIVEEAVARTQRRAPQLRFSVDLEPTVVVNAPDRVARAVSNVLDNARKWSAPDGHVEVVLRERQLFVRDHGPGFSPEDLPQVFERFYRAQSARRMPGSGLGLAIVRQTAEAHGGSAQAANAPDGGAILRVSFGSDPDPPTSP